MVTVSITTARECRPFSISVPGTDVEARMYPRTKPVRLGCIVRPDGKPDTARINSMVGNHPLKAEMVGYAVEDLVKALNSFVIIDSFPDHNARRRFRLTNQKSRYVKAYSHTSLLRSGRMTSILRPQLTTLAKIFPEDSEIGKKIKPYSDLFLQTTAATITTKGFGGITNRYEFETDYDKLSLGQKLQFAQQTATLIMLVLHSLSEGQTGQHVMLIPHIADIIAQEGLEHHLQMPFPAGTEAIQRFIQTDLTRL